MKQKSNRIWRCIRIPALILALFLLGSVGLWQSKRSTCDSVVEVWHDSWHLLTQRRNGHLTPGQNLGTLWLYLSSHVLDGSLYEWRQLEAQGMLPTGENRVDWCVDVEDPTELHRSTTETPDGERGFFVFLTSYAKDWVSEEGAHQVTRTVESLDVGGRVLYRMEGDALRWSGYTSMSHLIKLAYVNGVEKERIDITRLGERYLDFRYAEEETSLKPFRRAWRGSEILLDCACFQEPEE